MLTDTETSEALGFIRQARDRELARDPVHYYKLTAPDGSTSGDVLECHESHAAKLNEERMWRYLNSQRQRESDRLAREAKRQNEARIERYLADAAEEVARKAATQDIPLPAAEDRKRQALLESRLLHKREAALGLESFRTEPPVVWNSDDFLWTRVISPSSPIVRVEGTLRCKHD
jgi:hypothetical protein